MRETEVMNFNPWNIVWIGTLPIAILIGNLVAIFVFFKQKLRKRPHFLLISLAIADLMVGLVSIPVFVILHTNYMTRLLLLVFVSIDMLAGLASVFILAVISLEGMHAIGWPLRHCSLSSRVYIVGIVILWCLAAIAASSRLLFYYSVVTRQ